MAEISGASLGGGSGITPSSAPEEENKVPDPPPPPPPPPEISVNRDGGESSSTNVDDVVHPGDTITVNGEEHTIEAGSSVYDTLVNKAGLSAGETMNFINSSREGNAPAPVPAPTTNDAIANQPNVTIVNNDNGGNPPQPAAAVPPVQTDDTNNGNGNGEVVAPTNVAPTDVVTNQADGQQLQADEVPQAVVGELVTIFDSFPELQQQYPQSYAALMQFVQENPEYNTNRGRVNANNVDVEFTEAHRELLLAQLEKLGLPAELVDVLLSQNSTTMAFGNLGNFQNMTLDQILNAIATGNFAPPEAGAAAAGETPFSLNQGTGPFAVLNANNQPQQQPFNFDNLFGTGPAPILPNFTSPSAITRPGQFNQTQLFDAPFPGASVNFAGQSFQGGNDPLVGVLSNILSPF